MQPFFLPVPVGQRFCLFHAASGASSKGAVLYVHPFAEEMNKTRRMAALQSRALAVAGYDVLQIDLHGCGDSSGDFGDASWSGWREDVIAGVRWLRERTLAPLVLWAVRAGCLIASEVADEFSEPVDFVFWQPVISGKQHWQQFLRLKIAGELVSGQAKAVGDLLKQQLAAGEAVEIAGYEVSPALARGLEQADLKPPKAFSGRVIWLETSLRDEISLAPAALKRIEQWQSAGYHVDSQVVKGPAFWQTTETEEAPHLIAATLAGLEGLR